MGRSVAVLLHRYAGLYIACYLALIGLAGSLIVFYDELDRALTPEFHRAERLAERLDAVSLILRAQQLAPQARATDIILQERPGDTTLIRMEPRIDPETGRPFQLDFTEIYLDPYSGEERGRRRFGDLSQGVKNLMPFIYRFRYSLALGDFGVKLLGTTALIWTFDCFLGFYLTLPPLSPKGRERARRGWLSRWRVAWGIKFSSPVRALFDIHRAAGLWLWILLLIFAWSSVSFNLRDEVYTPVMRSILPFSAVQKAEPPVAEATADFMPLDWAASLQRGRAVMKSLRDEHGFDIEHEASLAVDRERGVYVYSVHSSLDIATSEGQTTATFSAKDGSFLTFDAPRSRYAGNTVTNWLAALHKGRVLGLPYKICICLLGLFVTTLALTGVFIWWKKFVARQAQTRRLTTARTQAPSTQAAL